MTMKTKETNRRKKFENKILKLFYLLFGLIKPSLILSSLYTKLYTFKTETFSFYQDYHYYDKYNNTH